MKKQNLYGILTVFIATVWLVNGLLAKVFGLVPRHQQIVAEIIGQEYSRMFTIIIGIAEIIMALWVLSKVKPRMNAIVQIIIISIMNILEFILVPDLLLWGKMNSFFALLFICLVWFNEFNLRTNRTAKTSQ